MFCLLFSYLTFCSNALALRKVLAIQRVQIKLHMQWHCHHFVWLVLNVNNCISPHLVEA